MQSRAFLDGEGDAYWQRNKDKAHANWDTDPVLRMIAKHNLRPVNVLELGCADGWRLYQLQQRLAAKCVGIDASREAIDYGEHHYPDVSLLSSPVEQKILWAQANFDLVIVHFVMHWLDRSSLFQTFAHVDRYLSEHGHLIIGDFWPDGFKKRRYAHAEGLWTYKARYDDMFLATGCYTLVDHDIYWYDESQSEKAFCALLQKKDGYECE